MINNVPPELHNASGIYEIRNLVNGKVYVGSTTRPFHIRWNEHFNALKHNKHCNYKLQRAFIKHTGSNLSFAVVVEIPRLEGESIRDFKGRMLRQEYAYMSTTKFDYNIVNELGVSPDRIAASRKAIAVISEHVARDIKILLLKGYSIEAIRVHYGISKYIPQSIKAGKSWRHIEPTKDEVDRFVAPVSLGMPMPEIVNKARYLIDCGYPKRAVSHYLGMTADFGKNLTHTNAYSEIKSQELSPDVAIRLTQSFYSFLLSYEEGNKRKRVLALQTGELNQAAKLTESQVLKVVTLLNEGATDRAIATQFNLAPATVNSIRRGKTWGRITQGLIDLRKPMRRTKLTFDDKRAIIGLIESGESVATVALRYNIHKSTICKWGGGR